MTRTTIVIVLLLLAIAGETAALLECHRNWKKLMAVEVCSPAMK